MIMEAVRRRAGDDRLLYILFFFQTKLEMCKEELSRTKREKGRI